MKKINLLVAIFLSGLFLFVASCNKTIDAEICTNQVSTKFENIIIEHSMKGWELYSWPTGENGCNAWNYVLLTGTNRLKSYSEITSDTVLLKVNDVNSLKFILSKFPAGESIVWRNGTWFNNAGGGGSSYTNIKLPTTGIQNEILNYAQQLALNIEVVN